MLKFSNLKVSSASLAILAGLMLTGCENEKNNEDNPKSYNENGVNAYVFDTGSDSFLTIQELSGINAKTYRDLKGLVNNNVDVLKLISPDKFNLEFFDDLEVDCLDLVTPKCDFDYNGISALNGLDSISIVIGNDTDLTNFVQYIKKINLSNIDLTIKIPDSNISDKFADILKKKFFKANSISLEVSTPKCLSFLYNLCAEDVKVSVLVDEDCDAEYDFQINKNVNHFILELAATKGDVTVNLNKLIIKSLNNCVDVIVEKTSHVNLIVPETAVLSVPDGTIIDVEDKNFLGLKNQD